MTYSGEILQTYPYGGCATHGLGLLSRGVIIGQKILLFKNVLQSLQRRCCKMTLGHAPAGQMP